MTGKILRSTEVKFEVTESKLSLLLKHMLCISRNTVMSSYCVYLQSLKSLKFENKENYFQTYAAGFVCSPYLVEKEQKVSSRFTSYYSIDASQVLVREVDLVFNMGRVLMKCS